MLNFFAIVLIFIILFFLLIFKRKYIINLLNIKNSYPNQSLNHNSKTVNSKPKKNSFTYQNKAKNYSKLHKLALTKKMFKLYKSNTEDKLKALDIAEELADKSVLPILRRGLKDMSPDVVQRSASLIRNFK